mmetsp:Transcript_11652/g.17700  ORF Transcript_11652/g.17700 Transcript_11652/m.17700 type:complete len:170 (-) Transcript_11652:811-1320(-)
MIKIIDVSKEVLYDKSKELNERLTLIHATVSHELRNPLNVIMAESTSIKTIFETLSTRLSDVDTISSETKKSLTNLTEALVKSQTSLSSSSQVMNYLINDFLDHASIRQGTFKKATARIDLSRTIKEVTDIFEAGAAAKNIIIKSDISEISRLGTSVSRTSLVTDGRRL